MNNAIPPGAYLASILVLLWSAFCLATSILLVGMLLANGERTNYVTLLAIAVCVSSTSSIVQQIYYACEWRTIKTVAWEQSKAAIDMPAISYTPLSTGFNLALFEIQWVCYSAVAILVLGWAIALAKGVYNLRLPQLAGKEQMISATSKVVAFILPAVLIGLSFMDPIMRSVSAFRALNSVVILASFGLGAVLMIATSIQYVRTRRMFASIQDSVSKGTTSGPHSNGPRAQKIRVDKVLLFRFLIAFVILAIFEVTIVCFQLIWSKSSSYLAEQEQADYSLSTARKDVILFIPGVTASLIAFLLFGTTAHFRKRYRDFFRSLHGACVRKRRPSLSRPRSGTDVWETLESDRPISTYRCTVRSGDADTLELTRPEKSWKEVEVSVQRADKGRDVFVPHSPGRDIAQPWRSLGIPQR
ncbi:hypothetical protein LTR56_021613 [Elasticomyces elasticus]|nr:hypothetical protein LTR56_021613 [Elasticomyces elasticus]KAK3630944.1 hypothetical protein LTR22_021275 [Elasticomyces elasticus]KAK4915945.1 hypothetical protein LTR49_015980 [Elasticomyces elasticus]KAK5754030.1 hypothetical protein LTS12_015884 [Elasticomyces elasticus]